LLLRPCLWSFVLTGTRPAVAPHTFPPSPPYGMGLFVDTRAPIAIFDGKRFCVPTIQWAGSSSRSSAVPESEEVSLVETVRVRKVNDATGHVSTLGDAKSVRRKIAGCFRAPDWAAERSKWPGRHRNSPISRMPGLPAAESSCPDAATRKWDDLRS